VSQTLIKLEGEKLRVTIKPGEYVYLDLSKRYFPLPQEVSSAGLGEPVITLEKVHLQCTTKTLKTATPVWRGTSTCSHSTATHPRQGG